MNENSGVYLLVTLPAMPSKDKRTTTKNLLHEDKILLLFVSECLFRSIGSHQVTAPFFLSEFYFCFILCL